MMLSTLSTLQHTVKLLVEYLWENRNVTAKYYVYHKPSFLVKVVVVDGRDERDGEL